METRQITLELLSRIHKGVQRTQKNRALTAP